MKKRLIVIIISLATSLEVIGQENPKINEVGISLQSFNSFGVTYRHGTTMGLIRVQGLGTNGSDLETNQDSLQRSSKGFSFNIRAGYEWRSTIADNIELRYGTDLFYGYSINNGTNDNPIYQYSQYESTRHNYGLSAILGANYLFTDNVFIGLEIIPSISRQHTKRIDSNSDTNEMREETTTGISYGFSLSNAILTLGLRF